LIAVFPVPSEQTTIRFAIGASSWRVLQT